MRDTVFIHSNRKQRLGALVSAYSMKARSQTPDAFDVRIIWADDSPFIKGHDKPHPDPRQEQFFFGLLREALAAGASPLSVVEEEIESQPVRRNALALVNAHLGNVG